MSHKSTQKRARAMRQQQPETFAVPHPASGELLQCRLHGGTGDSDLDALFPAIAGTFGRALAPATRPAGKGNRQG